MNLTFWQSTKLLIQNNLKNCKLYTIISEHSHTPYDKVYADSDRNYWMTAEEAKEYGMIDTVLVRK